MYFVLELGEDEGGAGYLGDAAGAGGDAFSPAAQVAQYPDDLDRPVAGDLPDNRPG
jgi:hypothetical protein